MAQFDVHRLSDDFLIVDVQSDLLDITETRFVIPLIVPDDDARPSERLHPEIRFAGTTYVLATHLAASVRVAVLGKALGSLTKSQYAIKSALDMLISGY